MPPVDLGLHFNGIGTLPRAKLRAPIARKVLLQAHRFTCIEALEDGIVDFVAPPEEMFEKAMEVARKWQVKAKMGVYSLNRTELYGEALSKFKAFSYFHGRMTSLPPKAKI